MLLSVSLASAEFAADHWQVGHDVVHGPLSFAIFEAESQEHLLQ